MPKSGGDAGKRQTTRDGDGSGAVPGAEVSGSELKCPVRSPTVAGTGRGYCTRVPQAACDGAVRVGTRHRVRYPDGPTPPFPQPAVAVLSPPTRPSAPVPA